MEKFTTLTSVAAPMMQSNVDTDIIVPMDRMVTADRDAMHTFAFEPWRFLPDGSENPEFILNQNTFRNAKILLTGKNFGCGSSREGAVWSIAGLGIRCLIGTSFGNIFYNNCFQNGILPIKLPPEVIEAFTVLANSGGNAAVFEVDLENGLITPSSGDPVTFDIEPNRRTQLLEGLDDVGVTLKRQGEIESFRESDQNNRPWIYV